MKKASALINQLLNILMASSLAIMAILVFGNVVLRYVFNSGIPWSEEMSRFLFVWMIFLGAIGALKENEHLVVDLLVKKLPPILRKGCFFLTQLIILGLLWLVLDGSWKMTILNWNSIAPATGLSLGFLYGVGIVMSIGMGIIVLSNLYRFSFRKNEDKGLLSEQGVASKDSVPTFAQGGGS